MRKGGNRHTKGGSGGDLKPADRQPQLESNWSRYDEFDEGKEGADNRTNATLDSLGSDFAKLLTESKDLSKVVLKSSSEASQPVGSGINDLFKIDVLKLADALNCQPFYLNLPDCERNDYFDDEVVAGFEAAAREKNEMFRLKWQQKKTTSEENIEKRPHVEDAVKQPSLELNAPKEQNINDWLDDLIN